MDTQARLDAMADAETLCWVSRSIFPGNRFYRTQQFRAIEYGVKAESAIVYGRDAHDHAAKAAHAAFRAIPELRGPDPNHCKLCMMPGAPSHSGSPRCESGAIAAGGRYAHCTCDTCF